MLTNAAACSMSAHPALCCDMRSALLPTEASSREFPINALHIFRPVHMRLVHSALKPHVFSTSKLMVSYQSVAPHFGQAGRKVEMQVEGSMSEPPMTQGGAQQDEGLPSNLTQALQDLAPHNSRAVQRLITGLRQGGTTEGLKA
ncbi:hypothetical protein IE81DRAFT_82979 [Ceraceosorus guamensis]|uniref:Uncharacterized protein n=1 Tax=Ceraceosorus guamensis TaxID=1522189 RepID=A0A316W859_9BASI|nr:hypothetical protein IE81DRAFT_82979 [Ceraceosorus guamensis]PWN46090.1 hypothetical protein IE81DRAFT_82979 [Ceraceosorus guamensis]